jgi:radical SAM protein with 4Fe4S-binding SPASM domain
MRKLRELNTPQYVIITGGEPLLRADIWDICKSFKSEEIGVVLLTNGSLIDDQNIDDVCKFVDFVQISIDGTETINDKIRGKGACKKTLEGVQILLSRGRKPHIAIVASRKNKADIPSLVLMLQRLGLDEIKVRPVIISGKAALNKERLSLSAMDYKDVIMNIYRAIQENSVDKSIMMRIERFLSHVKNPTKNIYGCQATISMCSVDPQGFVYPCIASHFDEFRAGSIRESTLDSIWLSSPVLAQWRTLDVRRKTKCNSCMWRLFCGGGCKINAYQKHGNLLFPDPYCSAYKSLYKDALLKAAHHCFENVKYEKESPVSECLKKAFQTECK